MQGEPTTVKITRPNKRFAKKDGIYCINLRSEKTQNAFWDTNL